MSRISSLYLADIIESCERVASYIDGMDIDGFIQDQKTVVAVVRNLEIIGEAVKNLPEEVRALEGEIEWKKIARFRDIIAHHYFKVDYFRVWDISENKLTELRSAALRLLNAVSATEEIN